MTQPVSPTIDCSAPRLRDGAQGIARVAVKDASAADPTMQLVVTFERPIQQPAQDYLLNTRSYSLTGGQRLFPRIQKVTLVGPSQVALLLDDEGDFSIYTLTVSGPDIDPFFASRRLRFRLACDDLFDCRTPAAAPAPEPEPAVAIDYLAKDYASFRQALLDFIPTRLPAWVERSEADIGMMLLELFAATADQLSYMQDRVANEAFLASATQRRSVAGHLALVDYELDEGAAAHTWLQFQVNGVQTLSGAPGLAVSTTPRRADEPVIVFETLGTATLRPEHNQIAVYTWGNQGCCLPRGSLSAALVGSFEHLAAGDYLLLDDGRGQRDIVRLSDRPTIIPADPIRARPDGPLTLVRWSPATPLRYDYCAADIIVRGNLALATHGETIAAPEVLRDASPGSAPPPQPGQRTPRLRLRLGQAPLAFIDTSTLALAAPLGQQPEQSGPAAFGARSARGVGALTIEVEGGPWQARPSLLDSRPDEQAFRVEVDDQGGATVVFGDNTFGRRPDESARISATYRVGGGAIGNIAADTLTLPRPRPQEPISWLVAVTNPLPATGGRNRETSDHARRFGPASLQQTLVSVTPADYQAAAQDFTDANGQQPLQRASAAFRWTGSWLTVALAVDPRAAEGLDDPLRQALLAFLDTRRLAGYDLEITRALYVPIDLAIEFCPARGFRPADVQQALQQALGGGDLPGGRKGFFHPDNFSFGDSLYVSRIYAALMAVPGVDSAQITRLARLRAARPDLETAANLRRGALSIGPDQIIRLDNDRNFPENGALSIRPKGGGA